MVTGISGIPFSFIKGFNPPFEFPEVSQYCSRAAAGEKGVILRWEGGGSRGFSRVVAGSLGFLLNCDGDGDLREPLILPQGS